MASAAYPIAVGRRMDPNAYDIVPYGSYPHPQTHTERLETIGRLFGIDPAGHARARVLELGCASGGNLIPMAFRLPWARFLGVDLSGRQIEDGRREVRELGLDNISLECRSILDVGADVGDFDYILCHGVYSWVSEEVRQKILSVCCANLAPRGIALVSYNTLPGWNMVKGLRDMMLYHVQPFDDPRERAEQARALLHFLHEAAAGQNTPHAALVGSEMEMLSQVEDSYLLHDHLEEVNQPVYFHEFVRAARGAGLEYLAESDLSTMLVTNLPEGIAQKLREIGDIVRTEQYMDFVRNRRFRSTLLCHRHHQPKRALGPGDVKPFLLSCSASPDQQIRDRQLEEGVEMTFSRGHTTVKARGRVAKAAMAVLCDLKGKPIAYDDLVERTIGVSGLNDRALVETQIDCDLNLCRLLFSGIVQIHSAPGRFATSVPERPAVSELVRHQARNDARVTSERHEGISLGRAERALVQLLDGTRGMPAIAEEMRCLVRKGDLTLKRDGEPVSADEDLGEEIQACCQAILERLVENALVLEEA